MKIYNKIFQIECPIENRSWSHITQRLSAFQNAEQISRLILVSADKQTLTFDATVVESEIQPIYAPLSSIRLRKSIKKSPFVVVNIIPTGVRAEIGGFAGDATPVSNLLALVCDHLITNPNAVTASDLYCGKSNICYLEGNLICHLLLGHLSIIPERKSRMAVVIEKPNDQALLNNVLNAINGMRAVGGLDIDPVVVTSKKIDVTCKYSSYGYATGEFKDVSTLTQALDIVQQSLVDTVAVVSSLTLSKDVREAYFSGKAMPNPWGAAEAMLTHSITHLYPVTTAHAPLLTDWGNSGAGVLVDPRDGAELISTAYVCSPIQGLMRSPKLVNWDTADNHRTEAGLSVEHISAVVLPASAVGNIPFLAAIDQKIPVILIKDNPTVMNVTAENLGIPVENHKIYQVNNYMEAVGVLMAIKDGIALESLSRPIHPLKPMVL